MKRNREKGSDEKQELGEGRLEILDFLQVQWGPFTDSSEVDIYRAREDLEQREQVKRMKQLHHPQKAPSSLQDPSHCA